jgi:hypothetical protein
MTNPTDLTTFASATAEEKQGAPCPYVDPSFVLDPYEPCPICGMLGLVSAEDKCIDRLTTLAAQEKSHGG